MDIFPMIATSSDPARPWTWLFVGLTFALYLFIGWRSRVRETAGFYVAGQGGAGHRQWRSNGRRLDECGIFYQYGWAH